MSPETLAQLRSIGKLVDPKYDGLAEAFDKMQNTIEDKNPEIISVTVKGKENLKFGDTITLEIITKDLINENIKISILDNDRIINKQSKSNDTLAWERNETIKSNKLVLKITLSKSMRDASFKKGEIEFEKADFYVRVSSNKTNTFYSSEFSVEDKFVVDYFGQEIKTPRGDSAKIQDNAIAILNSQSQAIAFITPEEKLFIWLDEYEWMGYFEDGIKKYNKSYIFYVNAIYEREESPVSWGLYLAASDSGEFVLNLLTDPEATLTGLGKALKKIVTLDFDIEKIWERIQNADATDATYVVSCILMARLASSNSKGIIKGVKSSFPAIAKKNLHKLAEIVEYYAARSANKLYSGAGGAIKTWAEILIIFKKALEFEALITKELLKKYPIAEGYIHISRLYLSVNNVVSIADNCIFNTNTGKWILNETKYGITNRLRKNQQTIDNAIRAGNGLEIRSVKLAEELIKKGYSYRGEKLVYIEEILRSYSLDGIINQNTIKPMWKK